MTPAELQALLKPHGIRALKSRSQHFLLDERVTEAMADAAGVREGSRVLEIGPGPGILTKTLLDRGAAVVAVELDARFTALLGERFAAQTSHFTLVQGDAIALPSTEIAEKFSDAGEKPGAYALVSNLPYTITSATLQKFLLESPRPTTITLMIQKEVADRILAKPGDMSSLAVMAQTLSDVSRVCEVPASSFVPPPKVASSVIHMVLKTGSEIAAFLGPIPQEKYFAIVQKAFSERRKQLKNTLRSFVGDAKKLENCLIKAKLKPTVRPEELSIQDWVALCRELLF